MDLYQKPRPHSGEEGQPIRKQKGSIKGTELKHCFHDRDDAPRGCTESLSEINKGYLELGTIQSCSSRVQELKKYGGGNEHTALLVSSGHTGVQGSGSPSVSESFGKITVC